MDIEVLIKTYPYLYHMAEEGSWPLIQKHGLLSTAALLDLHKVTGAVRASLETQRRPEKFSLTSKHFDTVVLRDQKPIIETKLQKCLQDGLHPSDWYRILNGKTFFWVDTNRLSTLLNAHHYKNGEHIVLTVRTEPLVRAYAETISLCHMNSGNTLPFAHPRGKNTFLPINQYPAKPSGLPVKRVAELVVDYGVPDIAKYVASVTRMRGDAVLGKIV